MNSSKSVSTQSDTLSQKMLQLNITSPIKIDLTDALHQTPPSHSSGLAESQPTSSPGLAIPTMEMKLKEASEEDGYHKGPKRVKVLSTTKPFKYNTGEKEMFHAMVATETEFFRVMVFDVTLQGMFAKKNPIVLTDYFCSNGSLVIHKASSVSAAADSSKMNISDTVKKNTKANPKIRDLHSQTREMLVYGDFRVCRKSDGNNCIRYVIQDNTGEMKMVVSGHLTEVNCEPGDTVRLVGFELTSDVGDWFLRAVKYSNMEVIKSENEEHLMQP